MTATQTHPTDPAPSPDSTTEDLADRVFGSALGAIDTLTIALGSRLGLYRALHRHGPLTASELAEHTDIHPRYAREWLEQQTVAGLLGTDDPSADAGSRRYSVPESHVPVLVDEDSLSFLAPVLSSIAAAGTQLPAIEQAFRVGGGVSWQQYGDHMREGQAAANRPLFLTVLAQQWLPSIADVHARLVQGGRVADIGCGYAWSSIGIASAYPDVIVDGFDVDAESVKAANRNAAAYGVAERVRVHLADGGDVPRAGEYDLVIANECVHDMPDPVSVLTGMRRLSAPGGAVLVLDERVPETFTGPGDPVEQLMYGFSVLICLPDGLSHDRSAGTGTVMRPATLRGYAEQAGFASVEVLPIEHDTFRLYRLHEETGGAGLRP